MAPPADAIPWMPVRPGTYADASGNNATGSGAGKGTWSITPALPHAAHLAGETALKLSVETLAPYTHTVAHLYDIDPTGRASLVTREAIATALTGTKELEFQLYPEDWVFEAGRRIGISLSGSDDNWYSPGVSQTTATVVGGSVTLPLLRYIPDDFIEWRGVQDPGHPDARCRDDRQLNRRGGAAAGAGTPPLVIRRRGLRTRRGFAATGHPRELGSTTVLPQ